MGGYLVWGSLASGGGLRKNLLHALAKPRPLCNDAAVLPNLPVTRTLSLIHVLMYLSIQIGICWKGVANQCWHGAPRPDGPLVNQSRDWEGKGKNADRWILSNKHTPRR